MSVGIAWLLHRDIGGAVIACDRRANYNTAYDDEYDKSIRYRGIHGVVTGTYTAHMIARRVLERVLIGDPDDGKRISLDVLSRCFRIEVDAIDWKPLQRNDGAPTWDLSILLTDGVELLEVTPCLNCRAYRRRVPVTIGSGGPVAFGAAVILGAGSDAEDAVHIARRAIHAATRLEATCGGRPIARYVRPSRDLRFAV